MSKLISGKEALIALANDQEVEYFDEKLGEWFCMDMTHHFKRDFRLKPRTITLNGIEVPAPFEPKYGEKLYYIDVRCGSGFNSITYRHDYKEYIQFGAWRTEEEIKQVVAAQRIVFKPQ